MKISGIDFPKPLLNALNDNQLVVFAGAGVSIPKPSGLPTFRELAEEIAQGSGETIGEGESEDRFLGRLADKKQLVHIQAAQVLRQKAPKPSSLHHDLTALYRNPESLRIVTTNFDTLFEEVAKPRFAEQPEIFRAPALPSGRDFNGIVHVHGSIDKPTDMVLTDMDFGRAYLTEGRAKDFLLDLFRTFPVLFVGYGHNDTVMNYLARALPPDQTQPRLVLTDETDADRWATLGITPLVFPKADRQDYSGLYDGVSGLAKYTTRGTLDWQVTIREIAMNSPSLDQEAMDTVSDGLSDPVRTHFFTEAASHVEWVQWLEENGHLEHLFGTGPPPTMEEPTRLLGRWLARTFAKDQPDALFRVIAKHDMDIHKGFWETLAWVVGSPEHTPDRTETLNRWVSLLLETAPSRPDTHFLLWIGERCKEANLTGSLLDIFRHMSAVRTQVRQRTIFSQEDPAPTTTVEIAQVHGQWELNALWEKGLKPNLNHVAELLLEQLTDQLTTRHRTLRAWQAATKDWDPDSYGRSSIAPHEQDSYPESIDVLIDAARDSLEYLVTTQPETAASWCDRLVRSDAPILRRLAIHALRMRGDLNPKDKIDWVLNKADINDLSAHQELFQVMRDLYPHATPEQRQGVMEEVTKFTLPDQEGRDTEDVIAYQQFTWFSWLSESDPECGLAKQRVEGVLQQHTNFKQKEHPDLTHYSTGGSVQDRSPWTTEELLSNPAKEWADRLLSFEDTDTFDLERESRTGLTRAVEEAATQDFVWGLELADILAQNESWGSDLWPPLMRTWANRQEQHEQQKVLVRLGQEELHKLHSRTIADTLRGLIHPGGLSHASSKLSQVNRIVATLWYNLDPHLPVIPAEDWYTKAINHPSGILTQAMLFSASSWYNEGGTRPAKLSDEYSAFLYNVLDNQATAGRLGRSVIAHYLAFAIAVDEQWTSEHLIPLFESGNTEERQAVWDGFLCGRLNPAVAEVLQDAFLNTVSSMNELFEEGTSSRQRFIYKYTDFVAHFVDAPLTSWIPAFFRQTQEDDRISFARNIAQILGNIATDQKQGLWDRWLHQYWQDRLHGRPAPITPAEAGVMLNWLIELDHLFEGAVNLAIQMPNPHLDQVSLVRHLNRWKATESHPVATAKLLVYLAESNPSQWLWYEGKNLIDKLIAHGLPQALEGELKDVKARLVP